MASVEAFYEGMCPHYHLLFEDWDRSIVQQGRALDGLIAAILGPGPRRVLDAACGIGTQALGLALRGHDVCGSDLSVPALARAAREAARLGVALDTKVADICSLSSVIEERFEVVAVLDNALAHLPTQDDLLAAARELRKRLVPGGLLLASIRDYDVLTRERPRVTPPSVFDDAQGRRVVFQVWDWAADGGSYDLTQYLVRHGAEAPTTLAFRIRVRAVTRGSVSVALEAAGLQELRWLEPAQSGFYQPIVAARRA